MLTLELIKNILENKDASPEYVFNKLKEVEHTSQTVKSLHKEKETERNKYQQKLKEIELKIAEIQNKCSHWTTTYHPDPSGNNDSYTECNICGKEL